MFEVEHAVVLVLTAGSIVQIDKDDKIGNELIDGELILSTALSRIDPIARLAVPGLYGSAAYVWGLQYQRANHYRRNLLLIQPYCMRRFHASSISL